MSAFSDRPLGPGDLDPALWHRLLARVRAHEPAATAVLINGSYAQRGASLTSDLDLEAIGPAPAIAYRTWFEPREDAPDLHVSLGARTAAAWRDAGAAPARWALGFPAVNTASYLWRDPEWPSELDDDPSVRHPPGDPALEDFVEAVMKSKRAAAAADVIGVRWAAQQAGALAPALLVGLNPERVVFNRRDALAAALALPVAPERFAGQLVTCLGLNPASAGEVAATAHALGLSLLGFLRERAPEVDPQPELARYLADGTLERHLGA